MAGETKRPVSSGEQEFESRLASNEADIRHISESVDSLTRAVSRQFTELSGKLDQLATKGAITWPLVFTAITTLLGIATVGGVIHAMSLSPLADGIGRNHEYLMIQRGELKEGDAKLSDRLQQEMRLLDREMGVKIDALERATFQDTGMAYHVRYAERLALVEALTGELQKEQNRRTDKVYGTHKP